MILYLLIAAIVGGVNFSIISMEDNDDVIFQLFTSSFIGMLWPITAGPVIARVTMFFLRNRK